MFLGCQKIDYHAKYCNIDPKDRGPYRRWKDQFMQLQNGNRTQNCEWKKKKKKKMMKIIIELIHEAMNVSPIIVPLVENKCYLN